MSEVYTPAAPDFSVGSLDLVTLQRSLKKDQKIAVQKLVDLMASKDDRIALEAARSYLKLAVEVSKEISADQLTRAIAQAKLNGPPLLQQPNMPRVDFSNIQDV